MITTQRDRWHRLSLIIMCLGGASLIAAVILFVLTLTGTFRDGNSKLGTATAFGGDAFNKARTPVATPTAPLPTPSEAAIAQLVIPKYDIDAPVVVRGVDANNTMETPDGPHDVAWYDFSAKPGFGSNAVFSGHVDYIHYGPAVFWHLKDLEAGDAIEVHLEDGTVYKYLVTSRHSVSSSPTEQELRDIIGGTQQDVVTLITCGGSWDGHEYDQRVIVRAERAVDTSTTQASGPTT